MQRGSDIREARGHREFKSVFYLIHSVLPCVSILVGLYVLGVDSMIVYILADCLYLVSAIWLSHLYALCITHKLMVSYPFFVALVKLLEDAGIVYAWIDKGVYAMGWLVIAGGVYKFFRRFVFEPMQIRMGDKRADKYRQDLYALRERRKSVMPDR